MTTSHRSRKETTIKADISPILYQKAHKRIGDELTIRTLRLDECSCLALRSQNNIDQYSFLSLYRFKRWL